jgi:Calx-beta domain
VNYATSDGTATLDDDYTAANGTLTFAAGETSKSFTVAVVNDDLDENDEIVNVTLSNPSSATLGTPFSAVLTIEDNDAPPAVAFASATTSKGEGSGTAEITVLLSAPSGQVVSVNYTSQDGTATAESDYGALSGTLNFAPGQTSAVIELAILNDDAREPDETVILNLSEPSNATLGAPSSMTLTIEDNDPNAELSLQFSSNNYSRGEGVGAAVISVQLSAASDQTVTVDYATSDGTATAGSDYTAANGTLTFAPGETSKSFSVLITNDGEVENDETVNLTLSAPANAVLGTINTATLTIEDNDTPENPDVGFTISLPVLKKE